MRVSFTASLLLCAALSAQAVDRAGLDAKIRDLTVKLEVMQAKPDRRIPAQVLRNAQGIVLLDRTKAGFLFAYQGGGGVAMVKSPKTGQWSAPAFVSANEASLGLQIGGQQAFVVILIMNTNATSLLAQQVIKFGGEASGTAGNSSAGVESTPANPEPMELVYGDAQGLFGGVAVKGGSLAPDPDADIAYYGQYLTSKEILFEDKAKPTQAATDLVTQIRQFSR